MPEPTPEPRPRALVAPTRTTERLRLRASAFEDFPAVAANAADPAAMDDLGVMDTRAAWRSFLSGIGNWPLFGTGWWVVELQATCEIVGQVGLFRRPTDPTLEMGWVIFRTHWRRGYATEAARGALAFAEEQFPGEPIMAIISASNTPSRAVAERLGFRDQGDHDFYGQTVRRYLRR